MEQRIYKLEGKVQHYAWGGKNFIPALTGLSSHDVPNAEYWMGAHPSASSLLMADRQGTSLHELIVTNPSRYIGDKVYHTFGELPYLFKVLDVHDMLSIQVHPSRSEAIKGFCAEEAAGIPISAPQRNYKDKNHKPEVMVALSEFWLLHGFKNEELLQQTLEAIPEFSFLINVFNREGYKGLYQTVMELSQDRVDAMLHPLVWREMQQQHHKQQPGFWVNKLYETTHEFSNIDRGIFSIYFFNIVQVQPGQAVFQGAGIPHAYLEGQNVELMANSDNVLRGGLTPKHIDVAQLLKHTAFHGVQPHVMDGISISDAEKNYPCPVEDFGISAIRLTPQIVYKGQSTSPEIFLVIDGEVTIADDAHFKKGDAFYVLPQTTFQISTKTTAQLYKAFVPVMQ